MSDYREQLVLSLSSTRELAAKSIKTAQGKYKERYDQKAAFSPLRVWDWVLVRFPQEETGRQRNLSRLWHGPFRIVARQDPDVTVIRVYSPQDREMRVRLSRVTPCPSEFPPGYYWYGAKRHSPGRPPRWVQQLLDGEPEEPDAETGPGAATGDDSVDEEPDVAVNDDSLDKDTVSESGYDECPEQSALGNPKSEPEVVTPTADRYTLRRRVAAPERLKLVATRSRSSSSEGGGGGGDVTD